jgi:hypothetical protein
VGLDADTLAGMQGGRNIKNGASGQATCSDIAALRSTTVSSGSRQLHTYYLNITLIYTHQPPASF